MNASRTVSIRPAERGMTILVVEDEPAMVGALGALLGHAGHRIVAAHDGEEALRRIRAHADTPIIVVSGGRDRGAPTELLDLGADDYVRKPFRADEPGWELDLRRHEIRWQGQPLPLTATEFRLLRTLVERRGPLVRHAELLAAGWPGVDDPDPLWLKPHLARLREKLRHAAARLPTPVHGVGYRLE